MTKLIPGFETVIFGPATEVNGEPHLITSTGLVPASALTAAAINEYQAITSSTAAQGHAGGNVSCAIIDDMNLGLASSDTSDTKTLCSKGNTETPTFYNFDAEFNFLRDEDTTATGVFNLAHDLTRAPDVAYLIIHRVRGGKDSTELFAGGDEIDVYYAWTDNPVPGFGDGDEQTIGQTMVAKGWVNLGYVLEA